MRWLRWALVVAAALAFLAVWAWAIAASAGGFS